MAAKLLGGADFRKVLRKQILDVADATDDPAYRERLLEVADGRRPLRTVLADPAFLDQKGLRNANIDAILRQQDEQIASDPDSIWHGSPDEVKDRFLTRLEEMGMPVPGLDELKAGFADAEEIGARTRAIIRQEELTGWGGTDERLAERDAKLKESK